MKTWFKRILIALPAIILLGFGGAWLYARTSLPTLDGTLSLPGLKAEVSVIRDENAIPHIYAQNTHDAYFALGVLHAQDRLWQMEMNRRTAQGRLSEILGETTVGTDTFLRTLGVYEKAKSALNHLDAATLEMLGAYADGVNAYLTQRDGMLPPEFVMLGVEPEPWTPADSLGWLKMMAWDLAGNWRNELNRLNLLADMTPAQLDVFYTNLNMEEDWPALPSPIDLYGETIDVAELLPETPPGLGSNNWVVSGAKSDTGMPYLANDPHLGLKAPSVWYLAHMNIAGKNIVGTTLPGVPFVVLGRNDNAAWGFTNTGTDVQDLYVERLLGDGQYQGPDGPLPLMVRTETIRVKDADDRVITVRETRHGPVISDALGTLPDALGPDMVLSFRWTALDDIDRTAQLGTKLLDVTNFADFETALSDYSGPQQNMVFADKSGNIGLVMPANAPIRAKENKAQGRLPVPGWDPIYDWQGYIPSAALPRFENPDEGYIATANWKTTPDNYAYNLTDRWAPPYRTFRIKDVLSRTGEYTLEGMQALQLDVESAMAAKFLPRMLAALQEPNPIFQSLSTWDYAMSEDASAPVIFLAWYRALLHRTIADEIGERSPNTFGLRDAFMARVYFGADGVWCDDTRTEQQETCDDMIRMAANDSQKALSEQFGPDWESYRWGDIHFATHQHQPFSAVPYLSDVFDIVSYRDGGPFTVNVSGVQNYRDYWAQTTHGPSYRVVYDLNNLDNSRFVIPTGQSGNIFSPYYNHLTDDWVSGRYFTIPTVWDDVMARSIGVLTLSPQTN